MGLVVGERDARILKGPSHWSSSFEYGAWRTLGFRTITKSPMAKRTTRLAMLRREIASFFACADEAASDLSLVGVYLVGAG